MKKTTILLLTLIMTLLLCACGSAKATEPAPTTAPTAEPKPTTTAASTEAPAPTSSAKPISPEVQELEAQNKKVWSEMHDREYREGRLVIPSAGINVALLSLSATSSPTTPRRTFPLFPTSRWEIRPICSPVTASSP